jgi:hypothetical protein
MLMLMLMLMFWAKAPTKFMARDDSSKTHLMQIALVWSSLRSIRKENKNPLVWSSVDADNNRTRVWSIRFRVLHWECNTGGFWTCMK